MLEDGTLGKTYGIKVWCYSKHLGGKHGKEQKKPSDPNVPHPPQKTNLRPLSPCFITSCSLSKIYIPTFVSHHFNLHSCKKMEYMCILGCVSKGCLGIIEDTIKYGKKN